MEKLGERYVSIEGIPFITRFKTIDVPISIQNTPIEGIEGIPFITRFKTFI